MFWYIFRKLFKNKEIQKITYFISKKSPAKLFTGREKQEKETVRPSLFLVWGLGQTPHFGKVFAKAIR
ncbi:MULTISPECIES: hypothetical protein [Lactococcus]|uniref:Uncharacterized protein n=1 Tax=Lactococcus garvieae TaxID=1363 RepID=H2AM35_9LACT|nr:MULTISPECIES: hypothetical protein [Lactococcus]CCF55367.1 hypothetical protein [Lactococcus garvieae]